MEWPLVSILIPVYQRGELSCETIDCALGLDYPNLEIIVGDNCSEDGSYELLVEKYSGNPRVVLFQNEENLGAVGNWQRCLDRSSGRYVKYLWSDDLLAEDYLKKTVRVLEEDEKLAFAFTAVKYFSDASEVLAGRGTEKAGEIHAGSLVFHTNPVRYRFGKSGAYSGEKLIGTVYKYSYKMAVSPLTAVFRREKVHLVSQIDNKPGYVHKLNGAGPDLLMFLEAVSNGESCYYINEPLCFARVHKGSISSYDKTVIQGYYTAKIDFARRKKKRYLLKYLNNEIILHYNKKFFDKKKNEQVLSDFYDNPKEKKHDRAGIVYDIIMAGIYRLWHLDGRLYFAEAPSFVDKK